MTANKRRTLGAALDVSPDQLAFIKGGLPTEAKAPSQNIAQPTQSLNQTPKLTVKAIGIDPSDTRVISAKSIQLENEVNDQELGEPESADRDFSQHDSEENDATDRSRQEQTVRRAKPRGRREPTAKEETYAGLTNLLVPLTTRLSPPTAAALKRAGLEQKLYGRQPGTVQEIAEEAIKEWLNGQGYL